MHLAYLAHLRALLAHTGESPGLCCITSPEPSNGNGGRSGGISLAVHTARQRSVQPYGTEGPLRRRRLQHLSRNAVGFAEERGTAQICSINGRHRRNVSNVPEYGERNHTAETSWRWLASRALRS